MWISKKKYEEVRKQEIELFETKCENIALEYKYEQQQTLANELSLKVNELQRELDKKDNLKTYKLGSGEEVKAQNIRVNEDWIEFIKDREVFKTVEKQRWELV